MLLLELDMNPVKSSFQKEKGKHIEFLRSFRSVVLRILGFRWGTYPGPGVEHAEFGGVGGEEHSASFWVEGRPASGGSVEADWEEQMRVGGPERDEAWNGLFDFALEGVKLTDEWWVLNGSTLFM